MTERPSLPFTRSPPLVASLTSRCARAHPRARSLAQTGAGDDPAGDEGDAAMTPLDKVIDEYLDRCADAIEDKNRPTQTQLDRAANASVPYRTGRQTCRWGGRRPGT